MNTVLIPILLPEVFRNECINSSAPVGMHSTSVPDRKSQTCHFSPMPKRELTKSSSIWSLLRRR